MKEATLCFLIRENQEGRELLLAMKKRGFGMGKWNGVGGKLDPEKGDKDIVDAAVRETEEEIGVKIGKPEKMAVLSFYFSDVPKEKEWDQDVHVFFTKDWQGEPRETEEMAPQWFKIDEIPYDEMWVDDKHWLPLVLKGKKLKADFVFHKEGDILSEYKIKQVRRIA